MPSFRKQGKTGHYTYGPFGGPKKGIPGARKHVKAYAKLTRRRHLKHTK